MQTYCPNCGAPFTNGTTKCEYCGAVLPVQQPTPPPQPTYQQPVYQRPVYQQPPVYQRNPYYNPHLPVKSRIVAAVLAFLLGGLGIHKFYLGKTTEGILMLVFCWTYIPAIIAFVDFIILVTSTDQAFMQKYNCRIN